MIKKLLLIAALMLPVFASAQTLKVGLVNTGDVVAAMPETTAAQTTLKEAQTKYQAEITRIEEEFKKQYEEFSALAEDELPAIKERKAKQLEETQQKYEAFQQSVYTDLQKQQEELMAPILQKVKDAIESVSKENGYTLVMDESTTIYYSTPVDDITDLVKKKLGI